MSYQVQTQIAGRTLTIETGTLARQAEGAVTVRYGDTMILSTSVSRDSANENASYFPLSVDVIERTYAAGKIKGSRFIKREGRPTDWAILTARLTDRPIRPLFPKDCRNEVQVLSTILSVDFENDPDILSIIGASAALSISAAPFMGPVGGVRIGYLNGELVVNPTNPQMEESMLDLVVAGTSDAIMMVEASAKEVSEDILIEALTLAHEEIKKIVALQEELISKVNPTKKHFTCVEISEQIQKAVQDLVGEEIKQKIDQNMANPGPEADLAIKSLFTTIRTKLETLVDEEHDMAVLDEAMFLYVKKLIRSNILERNIRPDGRKNTEIRPISCQVGIIPRTHGSALFNRGATQALTITTLASSFYQQVLDDINNEDETKKRYMHHYSALPYSVGEAGRIGIPKRREIGHGNLAERALHPVLPDKDGFPYTMRLVSEVLSQNGSSSMASVCGSTLSLMDAGVPITKPVAGIAMGLIYQNADKYQILSDIQGMEDFCGDMDFKVAGTKDGVTALQMDIKIKGITPQIMAEALKQALTGRLFILDKMLQVLDKPRAELSQYAPSIYPMKVDPDKIRDIIGPGGKVINKIIDLTGVKIDIEDDGLVMISSTDQEGLKQAIKMVEDLIAEPEVGKVYQGKVIKIMDFGAFVEILPGKEGLVHISQLAAHRVEKVEDIVKEGDEIQVKLVEIDSRGRLNLSKKAVENSDPK